METQKRITLNQMRQESLSKLSDKLNMFIYQLDKVNITSSNNSSFVKNAISNNLKKENKDKSFIWLIILSELENFLQNEYLFRNLFKENAFQNDYNLLKVTLNKLSKEQNEQFLIEENSLMKYIGLK